MNKIRRKALNGLYKTLEAINEQIQPQIGSLNDFATELQTVHDYLETIRDEEQDAYDNLPDSRKDADIGNAMTDAIQNMETAMAELETLIERIQEDITFDTILESLDDASAENS